MLFRSDGAGVPEQTAMFVDQPRLILTAVEPGCDSLGAIRVAWEEHHWSVVAWLCMKMDLRHVASATTGPDQGRWAPYRVAYAS